MENAKECFEAAEGRKSYCGRSFQIIPRMKLAIEDMKVIPKAEVENAFISWSRFR